MLYRTINEKKQFVFSFLIPVLSSAGGPLIVILTSLNSQVLASRACWQVSKRDYQALLGHQFVLIRTSGQDQLTILNYTTIPKYVGSGFLYKVVIPKPRHFNYSQYCKIVLRNSLFQVFFLLINLEPVRGKVPRNNTPVGEVWSHHIFVDQDSI